MADRASGRQDALAAAYDVIDQLFGLLRDRDRDLAHLHVMKATERELRQTRAHLRAIAEAQRAAADLTTLH